VNKELISDMERLRVLAVTCIQTVQRNAFSFEEWPAMTIIVSLSLAGSLMSAYAVPSSKEPVRKGPLGL
jgi:hypothetical protein